MSLVELKNVSVSVGEHVILHPTSLELRAGECLAVVGRNGAGKTTLLRAALGLCRHEGSVAIDTKDATSLSAKERAEAFAYLPQHDQLAEGLSALQVVEAARYRFSESRTDCKTACLLALNRFDAQYLEKRSWLALSGGERQRVALAALFAQQAKIAWLDEPANHLDPARRLEVLRHVRALATEHNLGIVIVTHDLSLLHALGDPASVRLVALNEGRLVANTTLADPKIESTLSEVFGCPIRRIAVAGRDVLLPWPEAHT